jgi:hypothetical protein
MPSTAPTRNLSYLVIKERHLVHQLQHRPSATYFQTPVDLLHALQKVRTSMLTITQPQEEEVSC